MSSVCPWDKILEVSASPVVCVHSVHVDHDFFEVANAHPENRHNVVLHHLDAWTDAVHVTRRNLLTKVQASGEVYLLSSSRSEEVLHLRVFMKNLQHLPELYAWELVAHRAAQGVRAQPQLAAVEPLVEPVMLPSASSVLALRESDPAALGVASRGSVSGTSDLVAMKHVWQVDKACAANGSHSARLSELQDYCLADIFRMADERALRLHNDEFGELCVAKNDSGTRYVNVQKVARPTQVVKIDECNVSSKLDCVLHLLRHGWVHGEPVGPFEEHGSYNFVCARLRPTSYFVCLLRHVELFAKGVQSIPHGAKDLHYQCLLRLHGLALQELLGMQASGGAEDAWCRQQLKGQSLSAVADAGDACEVSLFSAHQGELESGDASMPHAEIMPALLDLGAADGWRRTISHLEGHPDHRLCSITPRTKAGSSAGTSIASRMGTSIAFGTDSANATRRGRTSVPTSWLGRLVSHRAAVVIRTWPRNLALRM